MRTILVSIKPRPLSKICNFEKLWEVRKHSPTAGPPFRVLCCESGSHGMIKASFVCDKVIKKYPKEALAELEESCVPYENAVAYADGGRLHFWHISQLMVYDDCSPYHITSEGINRPPQSWQYVDTQERKEI